MLQGHQNIYFLINHPSQLFTVQTSLECMERQCPPLYIFSSLHIIVKHIQKTKTKLPSIKPCDFINLNIFKTTEDINSDIPYVMLAVRAGRYG